MELFKADSTSDIWKAYVDYVDEMVVDGFFNTIHCSLKFLLDNTDPKNNLGDLFKVGFVISFVLLKKGYIFGHKTLTK